MLIHLYLLLAAATLTLFVLGIKYGSYGTGTIIEKELKGTSGALSHQYMTKAFMTAVLFLGCMILSFVLSAASYDITIPQCDTYTSQTVLQADNVTTSYTNTQSCIYDQYTDDATADLFQGIAWLSLLMLLIFGVRDLSEMVS